MIEDWAELATRLTAAAESPRGRALCTELPLAQTAAEARSWMAQVAEVAALLRAGRTPPALATPEIEPALVAAEKQIVLGAEELRPVALLCGIATAARAFWGAYAEAAPEIARLARELAPPDDLAHTIGETFDGSGEIRDTASYELARLRAERQQVAGHARATIEALIRDDNFAPVLQDEYFTIRSDRYVLPLKASAKSMGLGIVHDTSRTGETVFVEPTALVGANNRLKVLELDIRRESRRILEAVTMEVAIAAKALRRTAETLGVLDARTAAGRLAVAYGGNAIAIDDGAREGNGQGPSLQLNQLRHPLLALARGADSSKVISNDVALGGAAARILVVSGPNAGGKTVLMKAIGLAAQMARAGLLVAAAPNSRVGFFDAVLTDIGDKQSVLGDLSTFSGHLGNLVRILDGSRQGATLVLLDELMAGTNPDQGAALARATAEALADRPALAVITTHYDSLKALGEGDARFANAGMEYDLDHLQPTFRLIVGAPGRSYAFDIAARMGMPQEILQRARELAGAPSVSLESVIARLEAREAALAKEAERLADATAEAAATADAQRTAAEALERRERELGRHAREAVEEAVADAREALRAIVREAQAANTSRAAEAARAAVTRAADDAKARMTLPDAEPEARPPAPRLELGARVFVERLGQAGVLAQLPDARGRAKVTVGAMTVDVSAEELRAAPSAAAKARAHQPRRAAAEPAPPSGDDPLALVSPSGGHTLDVRGRDGDDAVAALEAYLDRAALSGQSHLIVVHGHGTGALRKRIRAYLDESPYVARWAPGTPRQGGDGASVVELR
ncbi:MAG TPA: Smr/MutS family protein [Polyangia bacterium]|nr:Smr/MutS family protein [Polyangia bacterium]